MDRKPPVLGTHSDKPNINAVPEYSENIYLVDGTLDMQCQNILTIYIWLRVHAYILKVKKYS